MSLVKTLHGPTIAVDLARAYIALSRALLDHRHVALSDSVDLVDVVALDSVVVTTERPVDLCAAQSECELIQQRGERPSEIFDNLGHIFVLIQAAELLSAVSLAACICAPTQQSKYNEVSIADLEGEGWKLEAFGGLNVNNNGKLARDLSTLQAIPSGHAAFLAIREEAWKELRTLTSGERRRITASRRQKYGGPMQAFVTLKGRRNGVIVVEAHEIGPSKPI